MIIFHVLIFFACVIFFSFSISGYGKLISINKKNFFLEFFLGLILISFLITLTHFFTKISFLFSFIIFVLGMLIFWLKKNFNLPNLFNKKNIIYLVIIFLLIPIYLSQKYHEDFGYYHLPYALSFIEEKIVFGFANINKAYVYNSLWLNLYPVFFFK